MCMLYMSLATGKKYLKCRGIEVKLWEISPRNGILIDKPRVDCSMFELRFGTSRFRPALKSAGAAGRLWTRFNWSFNQVWRNPSRNPCLRRDRSRWSEHEGCKPDHWPDPKLFLMPRQMFKVCSHWSKTECQSDMAIKWVLINFILDLCERFLNGHFTLTKSNMNNIVQFQLQQKNHKKCLSRWVCFLVSLFEMTERRRSLRKFLCNNSFAVPNHDCGWFCVTCGKIPSVLLPKIWLGNIKLNVAA